MKKIKWIALMLVVLLSFGSGVASAESVYSMTWNNNPNPATYTGNQWSGTAGGWFWDLGTEGLFQFSRLTDSVTYRLATEVSHEGNVTTIKMRDDAKYSDGEPITAKDIWGFYQLHRETVTNYLKEIRIVDDYTLEFEFLDPAPFEDMRIWLISTSRQAGCPYHIYGKWIDRAAELWEMAPDAEPGVVTPYGKDMTGEEISQMWTENWNEMAQFVPEGKIMVSSGPYVQSALSESELIMVKNPNYWNADNVKFDKIISKVVTPEQGIAMLKSAQTDCYPGSLPIDVAESVLAANDDIVFYPTVDPACHGLYFNFKSENAPMYDKTFRKAINYLIDKTPCREVGNYYGQEFRYSCTGIPPMFLEKYVSQEVLDKMEIYDYNPQKAEEMLLEAGYTKQNGKWHDPEGKQITIKIGVNGSWQPAAVVGNVNAIVGEQLNAFGIDTEVLVTEGTIYPTKVKEGEFDMTFDWIDVAWSFAYPLFPLRDLYISDYARNNMQLDVDEDTNNPIYEGLTDFNGDPIDPVQVLLDMPSMESEEERLAWAEKLVWVANEECFGINLYQNCTGIWENRAHTQGLPYEDQIDANNQFMPVPDIDDPELEKIAALNWGFAGYNKLFFLEPTESNK